MSKPGRNDPCPCGSGKKYKKCCEKKSGRKFSANKLDGQSLKGKVSQIQGVSSFFQHKIATTIDETAKENPPSDQSESSTDEKKGPDKV